MVDKRLLVFILIVVILTGAFWISLILGIRAIREILEEPIYTGFYEIEELEDNNGDQIYRIQWLSRQLTIESTIQYPEEAKALMEGIGALYEF